MIGLSVAEKWAPEVSASSLPVLVRRAADALANAVTSAEVLDAKAKANFAYDAAKAVARFAKSKKAFDEIQSAVYRAQADALEIEAMAKRRFADEYDAAQARGEINRQGEGAHLSNEKVSVNELGLTYVEISDARKIRDREKSNPGIVRVALDALLHKGYDPTKAELTREINTRLSAYSGDNEWYTPSKYIEMAREVLGGIDVDPASNETAQKTIRAETFYTADIDGLHKNWRGRVWLNPPYSQPEINNFVEKLLSEITCGRVTAAVVLTNNSGDTSWHHLLADASAAICVTRGRIKFESPTRNSNSPAMGQSFFYFGPHPERFAAVFKDIGRISKSYWS